METAEMTYADRVADAFATVEREGIARWILGLLAASGQMRSAIELHARLVERDGTILQSEVVRALQWLGEWGLVVDVMVDGEDVSEVKYGLSNVGAFIIRGLS